MLEIQARGGRPQPSPVYFSRIALMQGAVHIADLPLAETAFDNTAASHLVREDGCWGTFESHHGRPARAMANYGSAFHKVVGIVALPASAPDPLTLVLEYRSAEPCDLVLTAYDRGRAIDLGGLTTVQGDWQVHTTSFNRLDAASPGPNVVVEAVGVEGAGDIVITRFAMIDGEGAEILAVSHGTPVSFRTHFEIRRAGLRERAQVFIIVSRNNIERVCKFKTDELVFDHASNPAGTIDMHLPKMMLGAGTYSVAVEIAAEDYLEQARTKFFSIDERVYHCITHALEFTVLDSGWIGAGTIFEGQGEWTMSVAAGELQ
jgi:hypothetical protein